MTMNKLWVGNIPYSWDEAKLKRYLKTDGDAHISQEKEKGRSKGHGWVSVSNDKVYDCLLLNNTSVGVGLNGRELRLQVRKWGTGNGR